MAWWTSWVVLAALLSGLFHSGSQLTVSAWVKDRNASRQAGRVGHSRSLKHNSLDKYYRDLDRPSVEKCVDPELQRRVRDASAIFTGTVRYMVDSGRRGGETVIVEIKRVIKGENVVDRFTSSTDQLNHRAGHHRRRRRLVAADQLNHRAGHHRQRRRLVADQLNHRAGHHRRRQLQHRMVVVTGLRDRERVCRSQTNPQDTWIFLTVVVSDPSPRLCLNSSLMRLSLSNILQVEDALKGQSW